MIILIGLAAKTYIDFSVHSIQNTAYEKFRIIIYEKGKQTVINQKNPYAQQLKERTEDFLISSDNALYEMVLKETISDIRKSDAIEIIYFKAKKLI